MRASEEEKLSESIDDSDLTPADAEAALARERRLKSGRIARIAPNLAKYFLDPDPETFERLRREVLDRMDDEFHG